MGGADNVRVDHLNTGEKQYTNSNNPRGSTGRRVKNYVYPFVGGLGRTRLRRRSPYSNPSRPACHLGLPRAPNRIVQRAILSSRNLNLFPLLKSDTNGNLSSDARKISPSAQP